MYRVLLVDDEPFFREGLIKSIDWARHGFEICGEADNGEDAIGKIARFSPDLVITDIKMPAVDGIKLIEHVSASPSLKKVKFLVLSGYSDFTYAQTAIRFDVRNYILKPVNIEEFTEALQTIYNELENEALMEKERLNSVRIIAEKNVGRLIKGELNKDIAQFMLQWLHMDESSNITCMIVELDNFDKIMDELDEKGILRNVSDFKRIVMNTIGDDNALYIYEEEVYRFCILVNEQLLKRFNNDIKRLVLALENAASQSDSISISIFVGKKVVGLSRIKSSYEAAVMARIYRFFISESCVVYFDQIDNLKYKYGFQSDIPFKQLITDIERCNRQGIIKGTAQILRIFREKMIAPDLIRAYINNFIFETLNHMSQAGYELPDQLDLRQWLRVSASGMTLEDEMNELTAFCLRCEDFIKSLDDSNRQPIVQKVLDYVNKNYRSDIYLKGIAADFQINPVYLGQLFKKQFGVYFNEYLNQLRIDESKKLLTDTGMKMHEISKAVGYANKEYFIKKFEKATSITPMQYRRLTTGKDDRQELE